MSKKRASVAFVIGLAACGSPPPLAVAPPAAPTPAAAPVAPAAPPGVKDDDLLYLEDVTGDKALAFAKAHNAVSQAGLEADPGFKKREDRVFSIYTSKQKIPRPAIANGAVRNFWTDDEHPRGILRQTTLADYKKPQPAWTTLLDIDALNKAENASFVFHGAPCLYPQERRCLVNLSPGGGDSQIVREFDADKKEFVKNGFVLPEAKSSVAWKDENTLFVATDFGAGSLTKSGYPRIVKEWKRGTPLGDAVKVFEVKETDISGGCYRSFDHDKKRDFCERGIDFEHSELSLLGDLREPVPRDSRGLVGNKLTKIDKPDDADAGVWDDDLLLRLRSEWIVGGATYKKGSLIVTNLKSFIDGKRDFQVLFEPTKQSSLASWEGTKTHILINVLTDVKNQITSFTKQNGKWGGAPLKEAASSVEANAFDPNRSDDVWLWTEDLIVPRTLELWSLRDGKRQPMKKSPAFFDTSKLEASQHFATSKDGTKVPYFEVSPKGRTAPGPTLLYAYGGFEISLGPWYQSTLGAAWLEPGGTYVQANLRGGGEYGPEWHEAAMKRKRQAAYDDMAAVAEDLMRRGVTTAKKLGIEGGSNGGLLTSVMLTQRPELFGAVVSQVPLTDMRRFHKLLAGASWMSEYGDPDDAEDWAAISKYSPFHNVRRDAPYPPTLFTTSTRDDRVHPGHARKMVAKLEALGHKPLYYENIEGGHGGAADIKQAAYVDALIYTFLATRLGLSN